MRKIDTALIDFFDSVAARLQRRGANLLELSMHASAMLCICAVMQSYHSRGSPVMIAITGAVFGISVIAKYIRWRNNGPDYTSNVRLVQSLNAMALACRESKYALRVFILVFFTMLSVLDVFMDAASLTLRFRTVIGVLLVASWYTEMYIECAFHIGPDARARREVTETNVATSRAS